MVMSVFVCECVIRAYMCSVFSKSFRAQISREE